jgi:hypothetical protein
VRSGQSSSSEASQEETLSPFLVFYFRRSLYDVATDGIKKVSKTIQFAPKPEIAVGMIFSFVFLCAGQG